jgi:predicted MFS family arabinose efflux permease
MAAQNGTIMAFGVLYLPLVRELGEGRGAVAVVHAAILLLTGLGAPLAGAGLDRWGPRRLFQTGAALAAIGLLVASQATTLPLLVLAYGVLAGAGLALLSSTANMVVVAQWYPGRPARAIALADLGTPAGTFLLVPLTQLVVERFGWRAGLLGLAALLALVVVPANGLQRLPAADPVGRSSAGIAGARRSPTFWWLAALRFVAGLGFAMVNLHAVAAAIDAGVAPLRAATAVGAVGIVSLAGRLGTGWLTDRLGPAPALTIAFASGAVGIACLGLLGTTRASAWLLAFVLFYGLAQGSGGIVAVAAATAAFRGQAVGAITGWIAAASGPGEALGAWSGGALHDTTGGYGAALGLAGAALAAGVLAIWQTRKEEVSHAQA